jgi:hypothetical protein
MAYLKGKKEEKAKEKPDEVQKKWMQRIDFAKKCNKQWKDDFKVDLGRQYYYGQQIPPGENSNEFIAVNKIYAHVQTQLPSLYSIDPYYYVKLKQSYKPEDLAAYEDNARLRQAALNYYKVELKLKEKARLGILDAEFAYGVLKTRYCFEEKEHEKAGQTIIGEESGKILKDGEKPLTYPETVPVNERFEIIRVQPDDFVWGDDSGPLDYSWPFIAERIRMTREQAEADKSLDQKIVKATKGFKDKADQKDETPTFWQKVSDAFGGDKDSGTEILIFWEVYDLQHKQWLKILENANAPVMEPAKLPKGVDRHPYSILRFALTHDGPYPIPPVSQALDPQKEYNLARSRILKHRKRFNRKYEVVANNLVNPDVDMGKLETGEDGTLIQVNAAGTVTPIQDAQLDGQSYQELALLNNDMVEIFGTPNNARGVSDTDSATEASLQDKYLGIREGDKLSMVTDWLIDVGQKLDMLLQAHMDKEMSVKVLGPRGAEWFDISPDAYQEIEGEYEYSVAVGATKPRIPEMQRAQWLAFMQLVTQMPHILTAPNFMKRMAEMHGIEDEAALEEMRQIGLKIMNGQMPMPGGGGSQAGAAEQNPIAAVLGTALGPMGGNNNGGGSEQSASVQ